MLWLKPYEQIRTYGYDHKRKSFFCVWTKVIYGIFVKLAKLTLHASCMFVLKLNSNGIYLHKIWDLLNIWFNVFVTSIFRGIKPRMSTFQAANTFLYLISNFTKPFNRFLLRCWDWFLNWNWFLNSDGMVKKTSYLF